MQEKNVTISKRLRLATIAVLFLGFAVKLAGPENGLLSLVYSFLLCLLCMFSFFYEKKIYRVNSSYDYFRILLLLIAVFIAYIILKQIMSLLGMNILYSPKDSFLEIPKLFGIIAAFLLGYRMSKDKDEATDLIELLLFAGALYAAFSIILYFLQSTGLFDGFVTDNNNLVANFANKSNAAIFFGSLAIFAYTRLLRRVVKTKTFSITNYNNLMPLLAFIFSYIALLLTGAPKPTHAFNIAIIICSLFIFRSHYPLVEYLVINAFIGTIFLISTFVFNNHIVTDVTNTAGNFSLRSLDHNLQTVIIGNGFGSIDSVIANLAQTNPEIVRPISLNIFATWFIEAGLFGIFILLAVNFFAIAPIIKHIVIGKTGSSVLIGILCVYALFVISGISFFDFKEPAIIGYFAVLMGAGVSLSVTRSRTN